MPSIAIFVALIVIVGLHSLCCSNEAIQDQNVSTYVFYITTLIMCDMHAHLLTLAKMATLPRLVQNCFKRKKSASGAITSMF